MSGGRSTVSDGSEEIRQCQGSKSGKAFALVLRALRRGVEHLPDRYKKGYKAIAALCPDYALLGDVANRLEA
jgi:hypothetical protein